MSAELPGTGFLEPVHKLLATQYAPPLNNGAQTAGLAGHETIDIPVFAVGFGARGRDLSRPNTELFARRVVQGAEGRDRKPNEVVHGGIGNVELVGKGRRLLLNSAAQERGLVAGVRRARGRDAGGNNGDVDEVRTSAHAADDDVGRGFPDVQGSCKCGVFGHEPILEIQARCAAQPCPLSGT
ncbi:hypothetical protein DFJ74DRAFT_144762 [Hyaloraphidium curvatum]|nr:hypothetical protein DFJ74DRAFT_144762 [Hyaloraphidium curvatum]